MSANFGIGFVIGATLSPAVASTFSKISEKINATRSQLAKASRDASGLSTAMSAEQNVTSLRLRRGDMAANIQNLRSQKAAGNAGAAAELRTALSHYKVLGEELKNAEAAYDKAHKKAKAFGVAVGGYGKAHADAAKAISTHNFKLEQYTKLNAQSEKRQALAGRMPAAIAMGMGLAAPVKTAITFESSFADLQKIADFKDKDQENTVKKDIFAASKMSGIGINEMTQIAAAGAETGAVLDENKAVDRDKLKVFLQDAAQMSVAYGISAEEAGKRMANMQTRMNLSADETRAMADSMNYIASKMNATADDTSKVIDRMGGLSKGVGLSSKAIAGLAAALVSTSESPEIAGTAMKKFLTTLASGDAMTNEQKKIVRSLGVDHIELAKKMKAGGATAESAILKVLAQVKTLPEHMQAAAAQQLFGTESLGSIAPLVNDLEKLKQAWKLAYAEEAQGSMLIEFQKKSETTQGAINRMTVSLEVLSNTVGSVLLPPLADLFKTATPIVDKIAAFAEKNSWLTQTVVGAGAGLVAFKVASIPVLYAVSLLKSATAGAQLAMGWLGRNTASTAGTTVASTAASTAHTAATTASTAALAKQGVASKAVGSGLRGIGRAWTIALGPIGLGIAAFELLYNNIAWIKEVIDSCIETIATKFPSIGKPLKAIAGWFGIGKQATDAAAENIDEQSPLADTIPVAPQPVAPSPHGKALALPPQPATTTPPAKAAKVVSPPSPTPVPQPEKASTQRPEKARPLATAAVQPQPVALTLQDKAVATPQPANTVVQPAQPVQAALPPVQQQPAKTVALPVQPTSSAQPEKTLALPTPSTTTTPPAKAAKVVSPPSPTPVPQPEKASTQRPEKARPLATAAVQPQPAPLPPQEKAVATPQPTKAAKVAFQPAQPTAPPAKATQPTAQELGQAKSQHIPVTPVSALSAAQNTAAPAVTQKPQGATPISLNSTFSFTLTGVDDMAFAQRVMAAIESRKGEVERLLSTIVSDQTRLAYGR